MEYSFAAFSAIPLSGDLERELLDSLCFVSYEIDRMFSDDFLIWVNICH